MIAKSHPETSDNTRKNIRQKAKNNNKWKRMNCLNYEPSQNLNRMYINKNVCPFNVSSSINQPSTFLRICAVPFNAMFWISSTIFLCINSISLLKLSLILPTSPTTTATTFAWTFHILEISICRSLYFNLFSFSFFNTFTSSGTSTSTIKQFCSLFFRIIKSGLFARIANVVC